MNGKIQKIMPKLYELDEKVNKIMVVSDLHGRPAVAEQAVKAWEKDNRAALVFLGDYADRGERGVEIIEWMSELSERKGIIFLKGNHENFSGTGLPLFSDCSLVSEARAKRGDWGTFFEATLKPFLAKLYLAALWPGKILFVHGGISSRINRLDDLKYPTPEIETDILWNDPQEKPGENPSPRNIGYQFGPETTAGVLKNLGVKLLIRGHQPYLAAERPSFSHGGQVMTLSSTDVFGGRPYYLEIYQGVEADSFTYQVHYKSRG
jgi:serine/threonine-protein phosphatase 2A catalytic subunit